MYQDPRVISIQQVVSYIKKEMVPAFKATERSLDILKHIKNDAETDELINKFLHIEKEFNRILKQIQEAHL